MTFTRTALLTLTTASLLALASHASATSLEANFDGLQEVPPNASPAFGLADVTLTGNTFTIDTGTYQDLLGGATAVTLNDAAIGSTGPILSVLTLDTPGANSGTFSLPGGGTLTPSQAADMLAGNTYINIRSNVFPSGEIRGQLFVTTPEPASLALLTPALLTLLKRRKIASV